MLKSLEKNIKKNNIENRLQNIEETHILVEKSWTTENNTGKIC